MQGQLSNHPAVELVHEISTHALSGVVRFTRERVKAAIYAHHGQIVLASANLRSARLADSLRRWDALGDDGMRKMETLLAMPAASSDAGLADLLVRHNVLDRTTLDFWQARGVEEILRLLMDWRDGEWEFDARVRLSETSHITINPQQLLLDTARAMNHEFIAARFADESETIRPVTATRPAVELTPGEGFLLSRVDVPLTVGELLQISALPTVETYRALYALVLGNYIRRDRPLRAFVAESVARERAAQSSVAMANPAADERARMVLEETEEERMKALFARGEATNHYAILGINHNAPTERIKTAYYALAKRFHPDVFSREIMTPDTRARIEAAFALISTAYETLKKTDSRAKYDLKMQALNPTPATENIPADAAGNDRTDAQNNARNHAALNYGAEENFKEAMRAEKDGNLVLALTRFADAARIAPQEARFRAHYGRALARDRSRRRQGEAELLAGVALAPADANLRVMLAEFYRDIGLHRRALGEVERALESEPEHMPARKLLKEIRRLV